MTATRWELAAIERMALCLRWGVAAGGRVEGRTMGRRLGSAGEFAGYRPYEAGDDLRSLDTKVYARLSRPVVRVRQEDSALPVTLLIDRSASMAGDARLARAEQLATLFVGMARRGHDPLRAYTFAGAQLDPIPSEALRIHTLAEELRRRAPAGDTDFGGAFRALPPDPHGRGVVIVITDGMGVTNPEAELAPLGRCGAPFWLALVTDEERAPVFDGNVTLRAREHMPSWHGWVDDDIRARYRRWMEAYLAAIRRRLQALGGELFVLRPEDSFAHLTAHIRATGKLVR